MLVLCPLMTWESFTFNVHITKSPCGKMLWSMRKLWKVIFGFFSFWHWESCLRTSSSPRLNWRLPRTCLKVTIKSDRELWHLTFNKEITNKQTNAWGFFFFFSGLILKKLLHTGNSLKVLEKVACYFCVEYLKIQIRTKGWIFMVKAQEWEPDHDLCVMKEWLHIMSFISVELLTVVMCLYRVAKLRMSANGLH